MKQSDPRRRGGDVWAFASPDGITPLSPYLGWLWWETKELRKWVRENWSGFDSYRQQQQKQKGGLSASAPPPQLE